jgi:hypothetical protein
MCADHRGGRGALSGSRNLCFRDTQRVTLQVLLAACCTTLPLQGGGGLVPARQYLDLTLAGGVGLVPAGDYTRPLAGGGGRGGAAAHHVYIYNYIYN